MNVAEMTFDQFVAKAKEDLAKKPNRFWAKKFDTHIHVPSNVGYGVLCNRWATRLGNNYAPIYTHKELCPDCLEKAYLQIKQI